MEIRDGARDLAECAMDAPGGWRLPASARRSSVAHRSSVARLGLLAALCLTPTLAACATGGVAAGPPVEPEDAVYAAELEVDFSRMERTSGGLWIQVVTEGVGRQAVRGRDAVIHFVGFLPDGTIVDSSLSGDPYAFELGSADVIRGWNEGIIGMKVGERRRLVVRPSLGYGGRGKAPAVPPNSILVFDIQLMDVR